MSNKKAAVELSMSFIVGLILGIIMLGFGLVFAYNIFSNVGKIQAQGLPDTFTMLAEDCVNNGEKVCIPVMRTEIASTKSKSLGAVVNNIEEGTHKFKTYVKFSKGMTDDEVAVNTVDIAKWTYTTFKPLTLENTKHDIIEIPFRVPAGTKDGKYVFNVNICYDSNKNPEPSKCPDSAYGSLYSPTAQVTIIVV